jgi:hypothetical protein
LSTEWTNFLGLWSPERKCRGVPVLAGIARNQSLSGDVRTVL